jgi:hypothetical protein
MNVYQIVCMILLIILLVLSLIFFVKKEKYQDMNSVHNHLTELENRIYSVERKDDSEKPSTENNLGNDKPEYVQKSIIGKDSVFYLPINGLRQNFLCKVTRPSHTDFYDEIGIIGQNSNGSTISNFSDDYNIIYSFYEKLDMVQKNKYIKTWETMVSPNNWNGLIKPYVLIRERSEKNNPEWEEGWLQVNVYPVGNMKRSNV